jgi:hypothetical protein
MDLYSHSPPTSNRMLKKTPSVVLGLSSRTSCTLRAPTALQPFWMPILNVPNIRSAWQSLRQHKYHLDKHRTLQQSQCLITTIVMLSLLASCASLSGGRTDTFYCSYDTVWDETLIALHPATFTTTEKEAGKIETDWEKGMSNSTSGALGRSNLVQERSSIVITLDNDEQLTTVRVNHVRQQHHLEGTRSLRWLHAPALPAVEHRILSRIYDRLKKQGCRAV